MPGTNFSEAWFTVGSSADTKAVASCMSTVLTYNRSNDGVLVSTNYLDFVKFNYGDVAAGNIYETTSYRTKYNNKCYALEYTIHSTNIGNYPAELGIKEFDKAKIVGIMDEIIIRSFHFIGN